MGRDHTILSGGGAIRTAVRARMSAESMHRMKDMRDVPAGARFTSACNSYHFRHFYRPLLCRHSRRRRIFHLGRRELDEREYGDRAGRDRQSARKTCRPSQRRPRPGRAKRKSCLSPPMWRSPRSNSPPATVAAPKAAPAAPKAAPCAAGPQPSRRSRPLPHPQRRCHARCRACRARVAARRARDRRGRRGTARRGPAAGRRCAAGQGGPIVHRRLAAGQAVAPPITASPATLPPPPSASSGDFEARGDERLAQGDVAAARLFFERAADEGNALAARRLGNSFDPTYLAHWGVRGMRGDPAEAARWYRRAGALGDSEAEQDLAALPQH